MRWVHVALAALVFAFIVVISIYGGKINHDVREQEAKMQIDCVKAGGHPETIGLSTTVICKK